MIKDKRKLKNYLCCNYNELKDNCYLMYNDYVISDKYSIVCLNEDNGLNIIRRTDNNNIYSKLEQFRNNFRYESRFIKEITPDYEKEYYYLNEDWSFDLKKVKEIKNLIKGNRFSIRELDKEDKKDDMYILEIFNEKTKEYGYLLPCKRY
jgi:hypothetical protein